jgi:RND superfamily putative drug exporter
VFPPGVESRAGIVALERDYAEGAINPLIVLADVEGDALAPDAIRTLAGLSAALAEVDGVARVEGPFSGLVNPLTGEPLTIEQLVVAYSDPTFRPVLQPLLDRYVRASTVRIDGITALPVASPQAGALVAAVRGLDPGPGIRISLGGTHAGSTDFLQATGERAPYMVVTVVLGMLVALFLLFGSVVLPIKAVLMTLLSIAASFGALVWIFQQGHLSDLLGFEPPGYTVAGTPIVMFAILVGLSMDYEVLLLSRIAEAWRRTRDNTRAVAEGLSRTAGVITGAALIMVVVFASFALADTLTIKALGLGMAIAVLLDATVVRILLVPATMRLVGDWNWWAPGPLRRIADRIGFDRPETDEEAAGPAGSGDPLWAGDAAGIPALPTSDAPSRRP